MQPEVRAAKALADLKVLDLTTDFGYAGKLFADLGAEVVLVEPPAGHPGRVRGGGLRFAYCSAGKRSVVLDLDLASDRDAFAGLCRAADIVIDDRPRMFWSARGLDYDALAARNRGLVWCSIRPFGQTGPCDGFKGNDAVAMAMGGMAWLTGYEDLGPIVAAGELSTFAAAQYAAVMALLAAVGRANVGSGQYIDLSVQEVVALGTETAPQIFDLQGRQRRRLGEDERQAGVGVYACRDGYVLVYASEEGLGTGWTRLVEWLRESGIEEAARLADPAWLKNAYKSTPEARAEFRLVFERFAATRGKQTLFEEGQRRRIAVAPINDSAEIHRDPHLRARGYFSTLRWRGKVLECPGAPYRLSATPWASDGVVPEADEHGAVLRGRGEPARPAPAAALPRLPLEGVRVIDFTWVGAGPFTTKVLANFGAEVIKIESRERPDQLRRAEPLVGGRGLNESGYFANRNTNKKSIDLDMKRPGARDIVLAMARRADVIANSFSPGVMARFGLTYADVAAVNPGIIYLSMPLAGDSGPYREYLGYGMSIAALIGMYHACGVPGRRPVGTGTNYPDHLPNPLHAAFAVLAALHYRRRTGVGQEISISQIESTLAAYPDAVLRFAATGEVTGPGEAPADRVPHGVFRCLGDDRWCVISVGSDEEFEALCTAIGRPSLAGDPAFATIERRREHRDRLHRIVGAWTAERPPEAVVRLLQAAGVPAGAVQTPADLVNDAHLLERGFWQRLEHPVMGRTLYHGVAARWSKTPAQYRSSAPLLGQHTYELPALTGLDLSRWFGAPEVTQ